jgi:hypothetical protein
MSGVLEKTAAHAEAKKIDPAFLMNMRLYPDMFPLVRQVRAVTDHAVGGVGRLAGVELPNFTGNETTFAELQARIAQAIASSRQSSPSKSTARKMPISC